MIIFFCIYVVLSIFLLLGALKALSFVSRISSADQSSGVSLVVPIYGGSSNLECCLRSWLTQKYSGEKEFIFSFQDPNDSSLAICESLKKEFQFKIIVNPVKNGFSGKGSNLYYGFQETRFENIVFADSDIFVNDETLAIIMGQLQGSSTLVSCLPVHVEPKNIWSNIYTYIWNIPLVCLWGPSMVSGNGIGVAGAVLAFKKELLEKIGGVQSFAGFLAEDLIFGELVKKAGGKLILGPKVLSPVERQSFAKLKNNLRRAHLIGLNFSKSSKLFSFVGIFLGYSYTFFPLCALIFWNSQFLLFWGLFVFTRFTFLTTFRFLAEEKLIFNISFLVGDTFNLISFILAVFNNTVIWGSDTHRIGMRAKIL